MHLIGLVHRWFLPERELPLEDALRVQLNHRIVAKRFPERPADRHDRATSLAIRLAKPLHHGGDTVVQATAHCPQACRTPTMKRASDFAVQEIAH